MKKVMALFAALILLLGCLPAQAEGFIVRFDETWINAYFLGEKCAWVLDRDGNLMRWSYDESEPAQIAVLPVPTREMFENYSKTYSELPAANRAQIEDTVTILAEDGELLYALNQYSGKLGIVTEGGLHWNGIFDASAFCLEEPISYWKSTCQTVKPGSFQPVKPIAWQRITDSFCWHVETGKALPR